ncbi:hypothetical protein [Gilvimarinus algae]|uniref:Uncharacterized protein n=1 Tax=Gilvimarinus algae TaxID=3058037 RepID=A0ABT8TLR4_9GAMM|nr:hypothetical protein [Gilvimarinus sp. SDUM040014]MDO3383307.1 hypothetical protein [Gilvimarinus sp. SDUM040014]
MLLQQALKDKICRFNSKCSYPVHQLEAWMASEALTAEEVLDTLYLVRRQLWVETEALQRKANVPPAVSERQRLWCVQCDQVIHFFQLLAERGEADTRLLSRGPDSSVE